MVFKNIVDNIKSFLQKEEELLRKPKKVPEAASEVLQEVPGEAPVVDKPLPESADPAAPEEHVAPKLPSADELRAALNKPKPSHTTFQSDTKPEPRHEPVSSTPVHTEAHEEISFSADDIRAFEESMTFEDEPRDHSVSQPSTAPVRQRPPVQAAPKLGDGFFASFEQFLNDNRLEYDHLEGDLLHKMRAFHHSREHGKEPLMSKGAASDAIRRRLGELQSLEHEWQQLYSESRDLERAMIHIEEEIDERTRALRSLLGESRHLALLSEEVPQDQAFVFNNGAEARSLGALLRILRADPGQFQQHVSSNHNDFASWIVGALKNRDLAEKVRSSKSVDEFSQAIGSNVE